MRDAHFDVKGYVLGSRSVCHCTKLTGSGGLLYVPDSPVRLGDWGNTNKSANAFVRSQQAITCAFHGPLYVALAVLGFK